MQFYRFFKIQPEHVSHFNYKLGSDTCELLVLDVMTVEHDLVLFMEIGLELMEAPSLGHEASIKKGNR